jgi:hypothetical protein
MLNQPKKTPAPGRDSQGGRETYDQLTASCIGVPPSKIKDGNCGYLHT